MQRQARKPVFEHRHFVIAGRQLGWMPRISGRGERVVFRRWQEGTILPVRRVYDPFLQEGMAAKMGIRRGGLASGAGRRGDFRRRSSIDPKPAPVRLDVFGPVHHVQ
jgi:hypothetical protein